MSNMGSGHTRKKTACNILSQHGNLKEWFVFPSSTDFSCCCLFRSRGLPGNYRSTMVTFSDIIIIGKSFLEFLIILFSTFFVKVCNYTINHTILLRKVLSAKRARGASRGSYPRNFIKEEFVALSRNCEGCDFNKTSTKYLEDKLGAR